MAPMFISSRRPFGGGGGVLHAGKEPRAAMKTDGRANARADRETTKTALAPAAVEGKGARVN